MRNLLGQAFPARCRTQRRTIHVGKDAPRDCQRRNRNLAVLWASPLDAPRRKRRAPTDNGAADPEDTSPPKERTFSRKDPLLVIAFESRHCFSSTGMDL